MVRRDVAFPLSVLNEDRGNSVVSEAEAELRKGYSTDKKTINL